MKKLKKWRGKTQIFLQNSKSGHPSAAQACPKTVEKKPAIGIMQNSTASVCPKAYQRRPGSMPVHGTFGPRALVRNRDKGIES